MRRIALTFDDHIEAFTVAWPLMAARGLVGTYFVDPYRIGMSGAPTRDNLTLLKIAGWTIGAYSGVNMVTALSADRNATMQRFADMKQLMRGYGLPVESLAAGQRAWDARLRNLMPNLFERVRVCDTFTTPQPWPFLDPYWIKYGSQASLQATDTAITLNANIDDILEGPDGIVHTFVIHRIGVDSDPLYSVSTAAFTALLDRLAAEVSACNLEVVGYDQL